jgi:hypothetical protein
MARIVLTTTPSRLGGVFADQRQIVDDSRDGGYVLVSSLGLASLIRSSHASHGLTPTVMAIEADIFGHPFAAPPSRM